MLIVPVFYILAGLLYKYSSGKWKVGEEKQEDYDQWVNEYGKKIKRSLKIIVVLYTLGLLTTLLV